MFKAHQANFGFLSEFPISTTGNSDRLPKLGQMCFDHEAREEVVILPCHGDHQRSTCARRETGLAPFHFFGLWNIRGGGIPRWCSGTYPVQTLRARSKCECSINLAALFLQGVETTTSLGLFPSMKGSGWSLWSVKSAPWM